MEEFRSSAVQNYSELGTNRGSGDLTGEQGFQAPTELGSVAPFQAGSESLSERHSELLNSSILNSFEKSRLFLHECIPGYIHRIRHVGV